MSQKATPTDFGTPDLTVAELQVWVHGWESPDTAEDEFGDWLRVTAHCGASGASVRAQGAILRLTDIDGFGDQCAAMHRGSATSATLEPLEPELKTSLEAEDGLGHIRARVEITPDHLAQVHRFEFQIDQSHLPGIVRQCSAIVEEYRTRGRQDRKGV